MCANSGKPERRHGVFANLAGATAWYVSANVASSVFMLVLTILLARFLGRASLGAFGLVTTAAVLLANVLSFVGPTVVLILAGRDRERGLAQVLGVGLVATTLTSSLAAALIFIDSPARSWLPAIPAGTELLVVAHTATQLMFMLGNAGYRGSDRFRASSLLVFANQVALVTGGVLGALTTSTVTGALWGAFAGSFLVALTAIVTEFRESGLALPRLAVVRVLMATIGLRAYVVKVLEITAEYFGVLYLSWTGDLVAVAALVAGSRIAQVVSKPGGMLNAIVAGKVAGQSATGRDAETVLTIARASLLAGGAISLPMLVAPTAIMVGLLGNSFQDTGNILLLFALAEVLRSYSSVTSGFLVGQDCRPQYVFAKALILLVTVVGTVTLGRAFGVAGVAGARALSELVAVVTTGALVAARAGSLRSLIWGGDPNIRDVARIAWRQVGKRFARVKK